MKELENKGFKSRYVVHVKGGGVMVHTTDCRYYKERGEDTSRNFWRDDFFENVEALEYAKNVDSNYSLCSKCIMP